MAEQASGSTRRKGSGKREESYGPGAGKGKARAPSQGRNKGKAQSKGGGKAKGHVQGQGSGKGSPPAPSAVQLDPLLEAAYQLYLRVAATTRAALAGTPGSATTSGTTVRCEPSSVNEWRPRRAHSAASARLQASPVARVSRLRPLPSDSRPRRPRPLQGTNMGGS